MGKPRTVPETEFAESPDDDFSAELDYDFAEAAQRQHRTSGERDLLRRLLDISIEDFRAGGERRLVAEAWFFGEAEPGPGIGFVYLCEHLDIDPDRIRALLPTARPSRTRRVTSGNSWRDARRRAA